MLRMNNERKYENRTTKRAARPNDHNIINSNVPPHPPLEVRSSCEENGSKVKCFEHVISLQKRLKNLATKKRKQRVTEWSPVIKTNVDHRHTLFFMFDNFGFSRGPVALHWWWPQPQLYWCTSNAPPRRAPSQETRVQRNPTDCEDINSHMPQWLHATLI